MQMNLNFALARFTRPVLANGGSRAWKNKPSVAHVSDLSAWLQNMVRYNKIFGKKNKMSLLYEPELLPY